MTYRALRQLFDICHAVADRRFAFFRDHAEVPLHQTRDDRCAIIGLRRVHEEYGLLAILELPHSGYFLFIAACPATQLFHHDSRGRRTLQGASDMLPWRNPS